jgi:membrane fusion protein (multidrug efflux system)
LSQHDDDRNDQARAQDKGKDDGKDQGRDQGRDQGKEDGQDKADGQDDGKGKDGPRKPSPLKNPKVKWTLIVVGIVVVVVLIAWLVYHLLVGRYLQETNDAYLQADSVAVAPRVDGYVTALHVRDHQWVKAGDPLLEIDERSYRADLEQAQAEVATRQADIAAAHAGIRSQQASLAQARTQVDSSSASLRFAESEVRRFEPLAGTGAETHERLENLRQQRDQARAQYESALAEVEGAAGQLESARAQLAQAQAGLKQSQANVDRARISVEDTRLRAPIDGRVGDRTVQVGQFLAAGTRTMSIVPVNALYLEANFKETQVGLMRPGQPAEIEIDALSGVTLHGRVESLAPGTGSQFALLPPENATGNFTKVVQRVPVRIRVLAGAEARKVLVPGLSVVVTVDTRSEQDAKERTEDESERIERQAEAR